jgi:RNA exonuclease 1
LDTSILYPHPRGLPYRRGLKELAAKYLNVFIQNDPGNGHDSFEDAAASMSLARLKLLKGSIFGKYA